MKFSQEIEIKVGDDGLVVLREPTPAEWNVFSANRYPMGKGNRMKDNSAVARAQLFDKLCVRIDNCEDSKGPIKVESIDRFPNRIKADIIFKVFEETSEIDIKN